MVSGIMSALDDLAKASDVVELTVEFSDQRSVDERWEASVTTFDQGQDKSQGDTGSGSAKASSPSHAISGALDAYTPTPAPTP